MRYIRLFTNLKLHWQIFISMLLGIITALIFKEDILIFAPLGEIFIRLLKMVIVPLVFMSIASGVAGVGDSKQLGRLGAKTMGYYFLTSILAIFIGLTLANLIKPGLGVVIPGGVVEFDATKLQQPSSLGNILIRMIPTNPIKAMANGDVLGVIFFSIVFGFAITKLKGKPQVFLQELVNSGFAAMMKLTGSIIKLAPLGVFGLITKVVATQGMELFKAVGLYMATIAIGLSIHLFIVLPLVLYGFTKIDPRKHFKAMASAMGMAFSSSSSGATLPVTIDCVENNAKVSNKITSFVLPLGATINMDGTALYECAGVLFIAQILGFDLSMTQQLVIVLTAFLASVGAAAIPSAGLVMIFIVLDAVGLANHPSTALIVGTMLAVDRPLDMYRTVVNVFSDSVGTVIIAKSEGENPLAN